MAEEKSYHHGDLRNALIQAGLEILSDEGANALSLRKVARRAGVSHAAPYRHFNDKEALLIAIAEEGFQKLSQQMQAAIDRFPDSPGEQLLEVGWAYISFGLENPDHLRVMFGGMIEKQAVDDANTFGLLLSAIQACQAAGIVKQGESQQLALTAWAQVHGLASLLIGRTLRTKIFNDHDHEQLARLCLLTLYDGLRKD